MVNIKIEKGESIDRALKRYKNKVSKINMHKILRDNKEYEKPSVKRRREILKAKYIQQLKKED